jgi:hypothetical protein
MSKLLRGLVVLSMAPMFAAYGDGGSEGALSGVSVGGEFYATGTFLAFSTDNPVATTEPTALSSLATAAPYVSNILGVSGLNYADGQDKLMNYGFGAALTASMEMGGGLDVVGRIAIHSALKDSVGLTSTTAGETFAGVTKSKMAFTPSVLVGMDGLHLGLGYRMTEYEFAALKTGTVDTEKTSKSNTIVFQVRGSAEVEAGDMSYSVFAFGETNLGREADSDVEDYMKLYGSDDGATMAAVTAPTKVHEAYNAFGIGIGANFYDA